MVAPACDLVERGQLAWPREADVCVDLLRPLLPLLPLLLQPAGQSRARRREVGGGQLKVCMAV